MTEGAEYKETVKEKLQKILEGWDTIRIRAYREGKAVNIPLSEASPARQALAVMGWMSNFDRVLGLAYELIHTMWGKYYFNE